MESTVKTVRMTETPEAPDKRPPYVGEAYVDEPVILPSYAEAPPRLVAGTLCLDFLNTVNRPRDGQPPNERLRDYGELLHWAAAAGALDKHDVRDLKYGAIAQPRAAALALDNAIALREALALLFGDSSEGTGTALTRVNELLARAPRRQRLVPRGEGYAWRIEQSEEDLERPLWQVLWDAAALLTSDRLAHIRSCAAPDCGWLFLDLTRNRRRRWCSMEDCGNRAKARRHYAKKKGHQA